MDLERCCTTFHRISIFCGLRNGNLAQCVHVDGAFPITGLKKKGSVGRGGDDPFSFFSYCMMKACLVVSGFSLKTRTTVEDVRFFRDDVQQTVRVFDTMGNPSATTQRCHPWEEMADDVLDARFPFFIFLSTCTCVCECLIMTEKRRGNASLPLMSVVNPLPIFSLVLARPLPLE